MKIVAVEARVYQIPGRRNAQDVPWVWGEMAQVYVSVTTEDGLEGIGEAFGYGIPGASAWVVNHTLAPLLVGRDAASIHDLTEMLFRKTHLFGRYGVTTFAISGVEMALWDLAGKRAEMPLYRLLGGAARTAIPAYASLVRYPEGHAQIEADARKAMDEGYAMLKLHQLSVESVALARAAIGADVPLTVDINCEWRPSEAIAMAQAMEAYALLWLEEPVWPPEDFASLNRVRAEGGVPLASGENLCTAVQFAEMAAQQAVDYLQPSVTKVGGIAQWLKVADIAELNGIGLAPHSPYFGPGFAATLHLLAHRNQAQWVEKIYFDLEVEIFKDPIRFADGAFLVPDGPGLGVTLDWEALEPFRKRD